MGGLKEVIENAKKSGISDEDLRVELKRKGYSDEEINNGFEKLQVNQVESKKSGRKKKLKLKRKIP